MTEPGWFGGRFKWAEGLREVQPEAILHFSFLKRLAAEDGGQHYYEIAPYRPKNLSAHLKLKSYYGRSIAERAAIKPVMSGARAPSRAWP